MKRLISPILSVAMLAMLSFSAIAAAKKAPSPAPAAAVQLTDNASQAVKGEGIASFLNGVACGAGVVALIGAAATGSALLGGPVGVYVTAVGTAAACGAAFF